MNKSKSLLREISSSFSDNPIIYETITNKNTGIKECYLKGIAIQAECRNLNERIYPLHEITNAVEQMRMKIKAGESILCEMDHPETLNINLDRVAGVITDAWMEGNNGMAIIKILPTPRGNEIRAMLESGIKLGVSSRGTGDVDNYGRVSGFDIITIDIVATPSAPQAYPDAVFESLYNTKGLLLKEHVFPQTQHQEPTLSRATDESSKIVEFFKKL